MSADPHDIDIELQQLAPLAVPVPPSRERFTVTPDDINKIVAGHKSLMRAVRRLWEPGVTAVNVREIVDGASRNFDAVEGSTEVARATSQPSRSPLVWRDVSASTVTEPLITALQNLGTVIELPDGSFSQDEWPLDSEISSSIDDLEGAVPGAYLRHLTPLGVRYTWQVGAEGVVQRLEPYQARYYRRPDVDAFPEGAEIDVVANGQLVGLRRIDGAWEKIAGQIGQITTLIQGYRAISIAEAEGVDAVEFDHPIRGGVFRVTRDDISGSVQRDPTKGRHFAFIDDSSGKSGGLVRAAGSGTSVDAAWFIAYTPEINDATGAETGRSTADWARALNDASAYVADGAVIRLPLAQTLSGKEIVHFDHDDLQLVGHDSTCEFPLVFTKARARLIDLTVSRSWLWGIALHRGQGNSMVNVSVKENNGCGLILGAGQHSQVAWGTFLNVVVEDNRGGGVVANGDQEGLICYKVRADYEDIGELLDDGQGYTDGWHSVELTGGTGNGATAVVHVIGGKVVLLVIQSCGSGYSIGDLLGIETPANGAASSIGSGRGCLWRVGAVKRLQAASGTKNWVNANTFVGLSVRANHHFGMNAWGSTGYNAFVGAQIEGNDTHYAPVYGEWALTKWLGGHIVQGNGPAYPGQRCLHYTGTGRHNVHVGVRLAALTFEGDFRDAVAFTDRTPPGQSSSFLLCEVKTPSTALAGWTAGMGRFEELEIGELVLDTLKMSATLSPIPDESISYAIADDRYSGHVVMVPTHELGRNAAFVELRLLVHAHRGPAGGFDSGGVCEVSVGITQRLNSTDAKAHFISRGSGLRLDEVASGVDENGDLRLVFDTRDIVALIIVSGEYRTSTGAYFKARPVEALPAPVRRVKRQGTVSRVDAGDLAFGSGGLDALIEQAGTSAWRIGDMLHVTGIGAAADGDSTSAHYILAERRTVGEARSIEWMQIPVGRAAAIAVLRSSSLIADIADIGNLRMRTTLAPIRPTAFRSRTADDQRTGHVLTIPIAPLGTGPNYAVIRLLVRSHRGTGGAFASNGVCEIAIAMTFTGTEAAAAFTSHGSGLWLDENASRMVDGNVRLVLDSEALQSAISAKGEYYSTDGTTIGASPVTGSLPAEPDRSITRTGETVRIDAAQQALDSPAVTALVESIDKNARAQLAELHVFNVEGGNGETTTALYRLMDVRRPGGYDREWQRVSFGPHTPPNLPVKTAFEPTLIIASIGDATIVYHHRIGLASTKDGYTKLQIYLECTVSWPEGEDSVAPSGFVRIDGIPAAAAITPGTFGQQLTIGRIEGVGLSTTAVSRAAAAFDTIVMLLEVRPPAKPIPINAARLVNGQRLIVEVGGEYQPA